MPSQPALGDPVDWSPVAPPAAAPLSGAHVLLRPVDVAADAQALYDESHEPLGDPAIWTYLPDGPYANVAALRRMLDWAQSSQDPLYFSVVPRAEDTAQGLASYLRITPEFGVIEIGHIWFGPRLQRSRAATEAIFLLAAHVFEDLGYRRLEWKCNALNAASRRAAERFGFTFEGVFSKHMVVKGRNRDTAWYAITDDQWPAIARGFRAWLAPENFDERGRQRLRLGHLIAEARAQA